MTAYAAWLAELLAELDRSGPQGRAAAAYARERGIRLSVGVQTTGARWKLGWRIELNPRYVLDPPPATYALSLLIHEMEHLRQGAWTALSVYGELAAWQAQFRFMKVQIGHYHSLSHIDGIIKQLMTLRLDWDRRVLETARTLMQAYAGKKYRIDLLPLYPLHWEILWRLTRRTPTDLLRYLQN